MRMFWMSKNAPLWKMFLSEKKMCSFCAALCKKKRICAKNKNYE
jgi:hypothetical protein